MIQQHICSILVREMASTTTVSGFLMHPPTLDVWLLLPPSPPLPKHSGPSSACHHGLLVSLTMVLLQQQSPCLLYGSSLFMLTHSLLGQEID